MDETEIQTTASNLLPLTTQYRKAFVKSFAELFQLKLDSYEKELQNKIEKSGTASTAAGGIGSGFGGVLGTLVGAPGAGSAVGRKVASLIGNKIGKTNHRTKAGKVNEFVHTYKNDLRKMLIQSGTKIFHCYEDQLMKVNTKGGWSIGMHAVAQEGVDRFVNYVDVNEDGIFSVDFITQGVVHGKSKGYIKNTIPKNKVEFNSTECKIASIYEKVGLKIIQEDLNKCYRKRNGESHTEKYGYRLLFNWELDNLDEIIENYIEEESQTENFKYTNLSELEEAEEVNSILKDINKVDPLLMPDNIHGEIRKGQEENKDNFFMLNQKCDQVASSLEIVHAKTTLIHEAIESSNSERSIPIWFDLIDPVISFTGRIIELENLHNHLQSERKQMIISQAAAISGLGGIGKSELARKYAHTYNEFYQNIMWINSETQETIKESFQKLAQELHIPVIEKIDLNYYQERKIINIVKDIYVHIRCSLSLFIFDNVDDYIDIKQFLPLYLSPSHKKPYILVTSRNCNWELGEDGEIEVLQLGNFTPDEAECFIKISLKINVNDTTYDTHIKELTTLLYCFPLALQQAQAYILEKNNELKLKYGQSFGIKDYIDLYKKENKRTELLNFSSKHGNDRYVKTVFTTWVITLDNLKQKTNGKVALLLVEIMAYFASDGISLEKIFSKILSPDKLWSGVELLGKYSIIKVVNGLASIHRLVQEVIRLELIKRKKEVEILREALSLINTTVNIIEDDITNFVSVWKHAAKHDKLVNEFYFSFIYGKGKNNPLHLLAQSGETKIIQCVLAKIKLRHLHKLRQILNVTDEYGRTPLYMAAENNHIETVSILHFEGADPNIPSRISYNSLSTRRASGWTPLHVVTFNGFIDIVTYLVNNGAKKDSKDSLNRTPLDLAVDAGHSQIVEILNPGNNEYLLHAAIQHERFNDVKAIFERGVNLNIRLANWTALHIASFGGHLQIAEFLVDNGAIVDDPSDDGFTPLHAAASNGHLAVLKYLISQIKYDISAIVNDDGWTLLHAAAQNGHLEVVKFLIEDMNQDINIRDMKDTTPLQTAAFHGKLNVVMYLLDKNADINAVDVIGSSILTSAIVNCHVDIVKLLLVRNDIIIYDISMKKRNLFSKLNFTILHLAAAYDLLDIVKDLIETHKLPVDLGENISLTPLHVASFFDSSSVINYLIDEGANVNSTINIWNFLKILNEVIEDGTVTNSSMKTVVSTLYTFAKYFYFTSICSFILTPNNIHKGLGYNLNHNLNNNANMNLSFIIKIIFNLQPIKKQINFVKSYMEEKKYKNPYSGTDADYFITIVSEDRKFGVKTVNLKVIFCLVIFVTSIAIITRTNVLASLMNVISLLCQYVYYMEV